VTERAELAPPGTTVIRLCAIALGLVVSCRSGDPAPPRIGTVSAPLMSAAEQLMGTDLPDKTLILTFDDGPSPIDVAGDLATWLHDRPTPIQATFFLNGACIAATTLTNNSCSTPTPNALDVIAKEIAEGHLVGNHTTTHRDLTTEVPAPELVQELAETDAEIASYIPWNRMLFRAPYGNWNDTDYQVISASAMNKYIGPVYWNIGGGPTDATRAADWECWQDGYTTRQCGDLYLNETHTLGRGIVLMHDRYGDTSNHDLDTGTGNSVDMVKYIIPTLEAEGYTFKALWDDPAVAALLPTCDSSCATCSGPAASQCLSCSAGSWLGGGSCHACSACAPGTHVETACSAAADTVCAPDATPPADGGVDGASDDAGEGTDGAALAGPGAGSPVTPATTPAGAIPAPAPNSSAADSSASETGGCRAAAGDGDAGGGSAGALTLAIGLVLLRLRPRRRKARRAEVGGRA
jgi:peptidoglycan/xylan/chitin deacetylase (PgdA/CDA1 family)